MRKYIYLLVAVSSLLLFRCSNKKENPVPEVYVDFHIYLNQPDFNALNSVGGWVYVSGGSRGILVYRLDLSTCVALDRNCTYNSTAANAIVTVDSTGLYARDTSCGSRFVLIDGSVSQGPATIGLRQYKADFDGFQTVHVHN